MLRTEFHAILPSALQVPEAVHLPQGRPKMSSVAPGIFLMWEYQMHDPGFT